MFHTFQLHKHVTLYNIHSKHINFETHIFGINEQTNNWNTRLAIPEENSADEKIIDAIERQLLYRHFLKFHNLVWTHI